MRKIILGISGVLFLINLCFAAPASTISVSNSFSANTTIYSSQVNTNFNDIVSGYNAHTHEDITKLGTISVGVWQGTVVDEVYGGTGYSSFTTGDMLYSSASTTLSKLSIGTAGQHLIVSGGIPAWSNAITATSGSLNNVTIGASTAAAGTFTTVTANTEVTTAALTATTITANTGITTAGLTATTDLDIGAYELRAQTLESDVATGTAPLTIASTTKVTNLNADKVDGYTSAGMVVQTVNTLVTAAATGTTVFVLDNTIPQNTEGDEYMSLAITPTSATNKLLIRVVANLSNNADPDSGMALFQDTTANALAAITYRSGVSGSISIPRVLEYYMTAGTTSATTFKVRAGGASNTTRFNCDGSGNAVFGGVDTSSITIMEIAT